MNIFVLDADPAVAARYHADTHVVKMVLETAQLLSTAWLTLHCPLYLAEGDPAALPDAFRMGARPVKGTADWDGPLPADPRAPPGLQWQLYGQRIYSRTHADHPCARWVRAAGGNYTWAWRLGVALAAEYTHRYGRAHATLAVLRTLEVAPPALRASAGERTPHAVVTGDAYYGADPVSAYRAYYADAKAELLYYTNREVPEWLR